MNLPRTAPSLARLFALALLGPTLVSCADDAPVAPPQVTPEAVRAAVTADVAASIDANGEFVFVVPPPSSVPTIGAARARELAVAYWRNYEESLRLIQAANRGPTGFAVSLKACPRTYYLESAYEPFGPDVTRGFRRTFGPQWLVGLCAGGEQQMAIAVSVEATDIEIDAKGHVSGNRAGDFLSKGVRPGTTIPASPEVTVVGAAARIGERVSALPVLLRKAQGWTPFDPVWSMPIENQANVTGRLSGVDRLISRLAFGSDREGAVGLLDGDPEFAGEPRDESVLISGSSTPAFVALRRADLPARFETVVRKE